MVFTSMSTLLVSGLIHAHSPAKKKKPVHVNFQVLAGTRISKTHENFISEKKSEGEMIFLLKITIKHQN